MSANMSWQKKCHSYAEDAISLIRDCVAIMRSRGMKTDSALQDLPEIIGATPRRVRSLFHREETRIVLKNEWLSLRYRAGLFFLNEAQRLRDLADDYEERGNNLVSGQMELFEECHTTTGSQKHCA